MFSTIKSYYSHWMLVGVFLFTPLLMPSAQAEFIPKGDETALSVRFGGGSGYHGRSYRRHRYRPYYRSHYYYGPRYRTYYSPYYYDPYYRYNRGGAGFYFRIR
jgi:hypothetical protein